MLNIMVINNDDIFIEYVWDSETAFLNDMKFGKSAPERNNYIVSMDTELESYNEDSLRNEGIYTVEDLMEWCEKKQARKATNMKIYCVRLSYDVADEIVGYATTEEKAKKMIEILKTVEGFEHCEFDYYYAFTDILEINDKIIPIE